MGVTMILTIFILCFFSHNYALLFHGDNIPGHSTTNGPIGKETTLSLLMQEILDLKAQDKSQEQEIQTLKNQTLSKDNVTASTVNKLASEYMDMKNAFGLMKQKIDQNNSQTELQTLKSRLDTIAQSIRYLTLSLQSHEIHDEETNMTIYREFEHLNSKLMNENQKLHEEILNLTNIESSDIQRLETIQQTTFTSLGSEIATQKTKLRNLNNNLLLHFDYRIRLVGGSSNSDRVEILYFGQWGTVCDDNFDNNAAEVVCRMLRKSTTNVVIYGNAHFGSGTGPIYFDELVCSGYESDWFSCQHPPLGVHNCDHDEDAGVQCG
ncbi:deleted in malignant brain tumors 1 protein-like [Crassostrea angulata]|uniref:deleted in malignant brain tumors 1 protein-like n=1 Tax=Magallana angulata TaxID=2784310 RepID=UPI0022B1035E|nr:deleted in malignant brain tumors 1 protein-like [Crassostrea angulata]XP_052693399.1 deleted in malignant brain tumors 1 protein-like [Crassostrea angulata]